MPQMSPLNWLILYPYFLLLFYAILVSIYFLSSPFKPPSTPSLRSWGTKNWQW